MPLTLNEDTGTLWDIPDDMTEADITAFFLALNKPDQDAQKVVAEGVVDGLGEIKNLLIEGQNNSLALYKQTPEVMATMSKQNKEAVREYQKATIAAVERVEQSVDKLVTALSVRARTLKVKRDNKDKVTRLEVDWA